MASEAQAKAFIAKIAPIAQRQAKKHGNKIFASVCIAQACNESGYGTSQKMIRANALYGIKVGKSAWKFGTAWKGAAYSTKTKEVYNGTTVNITDMFRAYDSIEDATEDYFDLICTAKRYKNALNRKTPLECITGIQQAPYATDPQYVSKIMTIINKNNITQYDSPNASQTVSSNPYPVPTRLIRKGCNGEDVKWVQHELNKHSYGLAEDGIYGKLSEAAVKDFQKKHNLLVDGIVGRQARAELVK